MSPGTAEDSTVLIVDDEPDVAELYRRRLVDLYTIETATSGAEALEQIDEEVDVVLLDRRMPRVTGDDVLESIRRENYPCRVIMATAIDPEVDIVEMPFDDYLCKPITRETLREAVSHQLTAKEYGETVQELFRATAKLGVLKANNSAEELEDEPEYHTLTDRIEQLREENSELLAELDDFETAFTAIDRGAVPPQ